LNRRKILWSLFATILLGFALLQFIPANPVLIPAQLPPDQRETHRVLAFEGIANFRDLGGYPTLDGRTVKWGKLYRSGTLADASRSDLEYLEDIKLSTLIDFRSSVEKEEEPNKLPEPLNFEIVEIPTLDDGNKAMIGEVMERIESGNFDGFNPDHFMLEANRQFASTFTPQFSQFVHTILEANGEPVAWHCSEGKDRTGFAAAILLRILGVPQDLIMLDYMESKTHALEARSRDLLMIRIFSGSEAEEKIAVLMGVKKAWLEAAFDTIDARWGDFDTYVHEGLGLQENDISKLKATLLQ
jgi:protein-tyrosine phosphatase